MVYHRQSNFPSAMPFISCISPPLLLLLMLMFPSMVFGSHEDHPSSMVTRSPVVAEGHHRLIRQFLPRGLTGTVRCPARADPPHRMIVWMKDDQVLTFERHRTREEDPDGESEDDELSVEYDNEEDDSWLEEDEVDEQEEKGQGDLTLEERMTIDIYGLLTIEDVTWSDAGIYKCTSYSPVDGNGETHIISVLVRGKRPSKYIRLCFFVFFAIKQIFQYFL